MTVCLKVSSIRVADGKSVGLGLLTLCVYQQGL